MTGPGKFVVFEGGEGSGKSTQAARVADAHGALLTRQPGGTEIGASIRELLLSNTTVGLSDRAEALLMAADKAQHVDELIRPALESGRDVVCDRYIASSMAYQGAGRQLGVDRIIELSKFAVGDVLPDVVLLLDVPVDVGLGRIEGEHDRLEQQQRDFHERVRDTYLKLAEGHDYWVRIDASQPVDAVAAAVDQALRERLGW